MNIDLLTLRLFVAVVEEQSVAKVAERELSCRGWRAGDQQPTSVSGRKRVRGQNPARFFGIYDVVRWDTTVSIAS